MEREELKFKLIEKMAFWSYDTQVSTLDDDITIEHCLIWGDVEDIVALFRIFEYEKIKDIWVERLVPLEDYYKDNYYLGKIFFGIENIKEFIEINKKKYSRSELIKQLVNENN